MEVKVVEGGVRLSPRQVIVAGGISVPPDATRSLTYTIPIRDLPLDLKVTGVKDVPEGLQVTGEAERCPAPTEPGRNRRFAVRDEGVSPAGTADEELVRALFDEHGGPLYGYVLRLTGDPGKGGGCRAGDAAAGVAAP